MKLFVAVASALFLSGCMHYPDSHTLSHANVAGQDSASCKMEKPTGSNRPIRVCRSTPDALEQDRTTRDMRTIQRQSELLDR